MKRLIGAAVAVAAVACAGTAGAATIIHQGSSSGPSLDIFYLGLSQSGRYKVDITTSKQSYIQADGNYEHNWDVYLAPAPQPQSEAIEGNEWDVWEYSSATGTSLSWIFNVIPTTRDFYTAPDWYEIAYGVPNGTLVYEETRAENAFISLYAVAVDDSDIAYSYSITLLDGAVPEPATWAMMIIGFGATGALLRRRRFGELAKAAL